MKLPLRLIILLAFGTCLGQNSGVELKTHFTKSEIKDLNLIADFFQSELCSSIDQDNFKKCFIESLPKYTALTQNYIGTQIRYRKQKKLYKNLSSSTFSKIWRLRVSYLMLEESKYEYNNISFSGNSKIVDFVNALGEENKYLKNYGNSLRNFGEFETGTLLTMDIMNQTNNWNLVDRNVQIFLAIHYLTQNDNINRDKKVKRLNRRQDRKIMRSLNN